MADYPTVVRAPRITIHTYSEEAVGQQLQAQTQAYNTAASATMQTNDRAYFIPFTLDVTITAVKMFTHNGATAAGNIDIGIYGNQGNRLVSSGSTAQAGTSVVQEYDITDTVLVPGYYFLAVAASDATATMFAGASGAVGNGIIMFQDSAFPLPNPATFARYTGTRCPIIGLTTRTVV